MMETTEVPLDEGEGWAWTESMVNKQNAKKRNTLVVSSRLVLGGYVLQYTLNFKSPLI